ncbi:MAG: hypothetical protein ACRCTL_16245, partial [Pseudomonas sp.]
QAGAFYSNPPPPQPLFSSNFLFSKEFSDQAAPEEVRIIGLQNSPSTAFCRSRRIYMPSGYFQPIQACMIQPSTPMAA